MNSEELLTNPESLFLQGSDDEKDVTNRHDALGHNRETSDVIDMDALFAGVDDDDAFTFKPLPPSLDIEALQREAEIRHKNVISTSTLHAVLPSTGKATNTADGSTKPTDTKKERRKPVKLDEGRLLAPTGFPKLIKDTSQFKIKGKGHEATDLNRLLQIYQFWTHGLYPKTQFRDTVERIEKLCHSKRMNVSLSVWRDDAHGRTGTNPDLQDDGALVDLASHEDSREMGSSDHRALSSDDVYDTPSRPPSHPPSSEIEPDDDDDFDLDAIFRTEDEKRAKEITANRIQATGTMTDDDTMWDALDELENTAKPASTTAGMNIDQTMWDEVDSIERMESTSSPTVEVSVIGRNMEDDEMWNVVDELEGTSAVVPTAPMSNTPAPVSDDYDIEDLYM